MKIKLLVDRSAVYDADGAVVPMHAGAVVDVKVEPSEAFAFWARMIQVGEAEQVAEPEPEPEERPQPRARSSARAKEANETE